MLRLACLGLLALTLVAQEPPLQSGAPHQDPREGLAEAPPHGWRLVLGEDAEAELEITEDGLALRPRRPGTELGHIRLERPGSPVAEGERYTLRFEARADAPRAVLAGVAGGDNAPLGLHRQLTLGADWKRFALSFTASGSADSARIVFLTGQSAQAVYLRGVELGVDADHAHPPDGSGSFDLGLALLCGAIGMIAGIFMRMRRSSNA